MSTPPNDLRPSGPVELDDVDRELVRLLRGDGRMANRELAERVGVTEGTIGRVERGEPTVALGVAFEAAAISGVPLFTETGAALPALAEAVALDEARQARLAAELSARWTALELPG